VRPFFIEMLQLIFLAPEEILALLKCHRCLRNCLCYQTLRRFRDFCLEFKDIGIEIVGITQKCVDP
jgi:hypothetical protein